MLVTRVKFVDFCLQLMKMAQAEAAPTFQTTLDGWPTARQTDKEDLP